MKVLPHDLLRRAEILASEAVNKTGFKLRSALDDYNNVCECLEGSRISTGERAEWDEIRSELVAEVIRLSDRLG